MGFSARPQRQTTLQDLDTQDLINETLMQFTLKFTNPS